MTSVCTASIHHTPWGTRRAGIAPWYKHVVRQKERKDGLKEAAEKTKKEDRRKTAFFHLSLKIV